MDYNIYIHDKTNGQSKPTTPKPGGGSNTAPKDTPNDDEESVSKQSIVKAIASTPYGKVAIAVIAAAKIADKVTGVITPFVTRETGDYRFSVAYSNVKQSLSNFLNPIGYSISIATYNQQMRIFNEKQEQQRLLVGDAFLNSVSRKF